MLYFLFTFCRINGWICLYGLQYRSFHILQTPGRVFILQQDHIDCSPARTRADAPTWSSKNPQDTQPPPPCSHFQLWSSCISIFWAVKESPWYGKSCSRVQKLPLLASLKVYFYKSSIQHWNPRLFSPQSPALLTFTLPLFLWVAAHLSFPHQVVNIQPLKTQRRAI